MSRLTPESIRASQAELPPIGTGTVGAHNQAPLPKRNIQQQGSLCLPLGQFTYC
jgi:hypothetical protein